MRVKVFYGSQFGRLFSWFPISRGFLLILILFLLIQVVQVIISWVDYLGIRFLGFVPIQALFGVRWWCRGATTPWNHQRSTIRDGLAVRGHRVWHWVLT